MQTLAKKTSEAIDLHIDLTHSHHSFIFTHTHFSCIVSSLLPYPPRKHTPPFLFNVKTQTATQNYIVPIKFTV